jgi:hypothetical protein
VTKKVVGVFVRFIAPFMKEDAKLFSKVISSIFGHKSVVLKGFGTLENFTNPT